MIETASIFFYSYKKACKENIYNIYIYNKTWCLLVQYFKIFFREKSFPCWNSFNRKNPARKWRYFISFSFENDIHVTSLLYLLFEWLKWFVTYNSGLTKTQGGIRWRTTHMCKRGDSLLPTLWTNLTYYVLVLYFNVFIKLIERSCACWI